MKKQDDNPDIIQVEPVCGHRVGVEIYQNEDGTYDVSAYYFDDYWKEWTVIGNAEEENHFATKEEALERGKKILHEDLLPKRPIF